MPLVYYVEIAKKEKQDTYSITWRNHDEDVIDFISANMKLEEDVFLSALEKPDLHLTVGEALFRFLDGRSLRFTQLLEEVRKDGETLLLYLTTCPKTSDWPFELLAREGEFLCLKDLHLARRVSNWGSAKPINPEKRPLKVLFMACAPQDVHPELDYEREEGAFQLITRNIPVELSIEDSGSLEGLRYRLLNKQFDVLHIVGHAAAPQGKFPFFYMEDDAGRNQRITPPTLWNDALIENPPRLLFLSGCHTGKEANDIMRNASISYTRLLVHDFDLPAVLGWAKKVEDSQAYEAGKIIFSELSDGKPIYEAVQSARYFVREKFLGSSFCAWPLLRLYCNGTSLEPLISSGGDTQIQSKQKIPFTALESGNRVLEPEFVARRRQMQEIWRSFERESHHVGALLLGFRGAGKSSLIEKIIQRFGQRFDIKRVIQLYGQFDEKYFVMKLLEVFEKAGDKKGLEVMGRDEPFHEKLADLCATCFQESKYLLVLDGFEKNFVNEPGMNQFILEPFVESTLQALLYYLPFTGKSSNLLVASRRNFFLTREGHLYGRLREIRLYSFEYKHQVKLLRNLKNLNRFFLVDCKFTKQLLEVCCGNPLLMEKLNCLAGNFRFEEKESLLDLAIKTRNEFIAQSGVQQLYSGCQEKLQILLNEFSEYRLPIQERQMDFIAGKLKIDRVNDLLEVGIGLGLIEYREGNRTYELTPLLKTRVEEFLCSPS